MPRNWMRIYSRSKTIRITLLRRVQRRGSSASIPKTKAVTSFTNAKELTAKAIGRVSADTMSSLSFIRCCRPGGPACPFQRCLQRKQLETKTQSLLMREDFTLRDTWRNWHHINSSLTRPNSSIFQDPRATWKNCSTHFNPSLQWTSLKNWELPWKFRRTYTIQSKEKLTIVKPKNSNISASKSYHFSKRCKKKLPEPCRIKLKIIKTAQHSLTNLPNMRSWTFQIMWTKIRQAWYLETKSSRIRIHSS